MTVPNQAHQPRWDQICSTFRPTTTWPEDRSSEGTSRSSRASVSGQPQMAEGRPRGRPSSHLLTSETGSRFLSRVCNPFVDFLVLGLLPLLPASPADRA